MATKLQILGTGCPKCKALTRNAEKAIHELGLDVEIEKIESLAGIMAMGVMLTPALAVDGALKASGRVLSVDEVKDALTPMTTDFDQKAETWDENPERGARAEAVARQILARVPLSADMDILDFGCGTGLLGFSLLPHVASVTFADPSQGMLSQVEAKLRAGQHDGCRTLLLDPSALTLPQHYDAIVSLMSLHHVDDPPAVISLLADHLAPEGWMALSDLDTEDGTFHADPHAGVHHGFDRQLLYSLANGVGLQRVETSTAYVMRLERSEGERAYSLFLLTAQRPAIDPKDDATHARVSAETSGMTG